MEETEVGEEEVEGVVVDIQVEAVMEAGAVAGTKMLSNLVLDKHSLVPLPHHRQITIRDMPRVVTSKEGIKAAISNKVDTNKVAISKGDIKEATNNRVDINNREATNSKVDTNNMGVTIVEVAEEGEAAEVVGGAEVVRDIENLEFEFLPQTPLRIKEIVLLPKPFLSEMLFS